MSRQEAGAAVVVDKPDGYPAIHLRERLVSLDVFRGFTLLGMVLVNSQPGKIHPALAHAGWNRWAFADLIFPFFVFIVGVAIPYSVANRLEGGVSRPRLFWQILRRCVLLFALECAKSSFRTLPAAC